MAFANLRSQVDDYIKSKSWYWYVPFWLFGLYLFIKLLDFRLTEPAPSFFIAIAQGFDFFLHEMSHLFFGFGPQIVAAAAGSGSELLLGLGLIMTAFLTRSYFASLFCCLWFMLACLATADYMADARSKAMDLVSFGGSDPIHDWNFIFGQLGLLPQDKLIAAITRGIGIAVGLAGLVWSGSLIIRMVLAKRKEQHEKRMAEIMNHVASKRPEQRPEDQKFISESLYPTAEKGPMSETDPAEKSPQNRL